MLHDADLALYASKARGRACFTFHGPGIDAPAAPDSASGR